MSRPRDAPLLHPTTARLVALLALTAFGALHWMTMLDPAQPGRAGVALILAAAVAGALVGLRRMPARWWPVAAAAVGLGGFTAALLAGGAHGSQLEPRHWGALAGRISDGVGAMTGVRIPYDGPDPAVRLALGVGGTVLALAGTLLACWPRRDGRLGFPAAALVALGLLYAVPAVAAPLRLEFLRGALLALLLVAYLRLHRLRRRDAPLAGALALGTALLALLAAPALDGGRPWFDYQDWALSAARARSVTFDWDHHYTTLRWPRDGRELLRIRSPQRAYWKADELDIFDGREWVHDRYFDASQSPDAQVESVPLADQRRWSFRVAVTVRDLRSATLPLAGSPLEVTMPDEVPLQVRPSVWSIGRPIANGDAYSGLVYVPKPSEAELRSAGADYPLDLQPYTVVAVVPRHAGANARPTFIGPDRFFGGAPVRMDVTEAPATDLLRHSDLWRAYRLSLRLLDRSATPYDYLKAVQEHLDHGFTYSEAPPPASRTLDGFLFESHAGWCEQFSGSMALLLRLGGIPARVATGFAPGSYDRAAGQYVVRDVDAHSWVEAWFPRIGWVTFDPTPSAAPPRSQALLSSPSAARGSVRDIGTTQLDTIPVPARRPGRAIPWLALLAVVGGLAMAGTLLRGRGARRARRAAGPIGELERALAQVGEPLSPRTTLAALETRLATRPEAARYVATLRAERFQPAGAAPTPAQRRGLRRALGRGRGPLGRWRAWRAVPPRLPHRDLH